ncbi:MAG TPA: hypothetical protein VG167_18355 [Verrucomicrobiae bacterium]|nr:hypothetical protein [Verrucomicrobiae bacterium]
MKPTELLRWKLRMRQLLRYQPRFWRADVVDCACVSLLAGKKITLNREFLQNAAELEFSFSVKWPPFGLGRPRQVRVALERAEPAAIEEAGSARLNAGRRPAPNEPLSWAPVAIQALEEKIVRHRTHVRLRLAGIDAGKAARWRVRISDATDACSIGQLEFRGLPQGEAQELRFANMRAEQVRLCVLSARQRHYSSVVPLSSDFVQVELTIPEDKLSPFLPPVPAVITLSLQTNRIRSELQQLPVQLTDGPLNFTSLPISIHDASILARPGNHCFVLSVGPRELARVPFRLVTEAEIRGAVRVNRIHIAAQRRNGKTVRGLKVLRWEEHRALLPWLQVQCGIVAPNSAIRCTVRTLQSRTLLGKETVFLNLDRHSQLVRLRRLDLAGLGLPARSKPTRLSLIVQLAGETKASLQVVILPPERLTNFEGQLKVDARHLPLDENDYDQIIRSLGVLEGGAPRRRFWRWFLRRDA